MRHGRSGLEVLVVHRDRYDDWTFPKGKCEPDESDEACALREVEEETGLRCSARDELPSTSYLDARGRPKSVRYWRLDVVGGELAFDHEVDERALGVARRGRGAAHVRARSRGAPALRRRCR